MFARGVHRVNVQYPGLSLRQQTYQRALLHMNPGLIRGQQRNTGPRQCGAQQRAGFIGADIALHRHCDVFTAPGEMPQAFAVIGVGQAVVPAEFFNLLRCRMFTQIGRGRTQHGATDRQLAGNQVRVQVIAGTNRQINTFIHQVHCAVEHLQIDADLWIEPYIVSNGTSQLGLAERGTDADAQQAPRRITGNTDSGLQVISQFQ